MNNRDMPEVGVGSLRPEGGGRRPTAEGVRRRAKAEGCYIRENASHVSASESSSFWPLRSVRTSHALAPTRSSHARLELFATDLQGSSRAGCTASDATASCAGLLLIFQAMIDKPTSNGTRETMAASRPSLQPHVLTSAENKKSGVATSVGMPSPP